MNKVQLANSKYVLDSHARTPLPCVHLNKIKYSLNVNIPVYLYEDVELLIEFEAQKMLSVPFKCWFSYILSIYLSIYIHTLFSSPK